MNKNYLIFGRIGLLVLSQTAIAHTTIKEGSIEGTTLYTADVINHGCVSGTNPKIPVIAESVVFPNGSDSVATVLSNSGDAEQPIDINSVIEGGALTIIPTGIQDKNVFNVHTVQTDSLGNVRGFQYLSNSSSNTRAFNYSIPTLTIPPGPQSVTGLPASSATTNNAAPQGQEGELQLDLVGVIPFKLAGVSFQASSCATQLNIRIGIVDWCTQGTDDQRNDIWIGHTTSVFNETDRIATGTLGYWPTLTITRDLAKNPLPESCGGGQIVAVEPSDDAIDTYLPMSGFTP
ncbi:hypothetical protein [Candidatus Nitrosacidococcus sp. I8]|uniref:hypothetical protein n=1 Tax=Candidatus Nitrosacidococcus sp. I8 TaxID=2942908 RepID=UPI002226E7EC|nr:hypothetical protein [Candidatus Nitrosacidococcus sp. I8]CAH9017692.1 hypothetical protein NURINAE_00500 [Candidatus Nitrosacidococcus sp. I8]